MNEFFGYLDDFKIEVPSWGFADTGTRFGKFLQPAAASSIEEKLEDAGLVHRLTGACPTVAVHVLWDFKPESSPHETAKIAAQYGVKIGSINPNLFQNAEYKLGSCCSPDETARRNATEHVLHSIELGKATGSNLLSLWFADGTNYPGQDDIIARKGRMEAALRLWHEAMPREMTMLVEYKPFEPAFYHTDSADWGMAAFFCQKAGSQAKVLVDTGHHLPGANIEHIVAFLLDEGLLGGFHFNDRKYADDDLTIGSIDPYAVFRIFHEIRNAAHRGVDVSGIAYMVDQSHNLKPKLEAMVQTVVTAQELYLKACLVDRDKLAAFQVKQDIVGAEETLRRAFYSDVTATLRAWREENELPVDPLQSLRESDEIERRIRQRGASKPIVASTYA